MCQLYATERVNFAPNPAKITTETRSDKSDYHLLTPQYHSTSSHYVISQQWFVNLCSVGAERRPWSDCAEIQAELGLWPA